MPNFINKVVRFINNVKTLIKKTWIKYKFIANEQNINKSPLQSCHRMDDTMKYKWQIGYCLILYVDKQ